jgi:GT2 family glycosyltransferase
VTEVAPPFVNGSDGGAVTKPVLSIVILTWDSRALLEACLAAVPAATGPLAAEVIVVDNGSRDDTASLLARRRELVVIRNPRNRGVAPARNQGLRAACGGFVALLDVDTVPAPGSLARLVAYLRAAPHVGLVGPKLVGADGRLQYSCRRFPTLLDKLLRRLPERWGRAVTDDVELRWWDHATPRAVDYVIGACQVIRRAALDEVGLLDERIFYGPEDVDLCLRLQRAGWGVVYVPEAVVMHLERRVTRKLLSTLTARHLQGLGYYFWKHGYLLTRPRLSARRAA